MLPWFNSEHETVVSGGRVLWKNLKIRPTRLGIGLLVIAVAVWFGALNYSINLAYVLSFWILSFFIMAYLQTSLQLLGLKAQVYCHQELFAGDQATLELVFDSMASRYRAFTIDFDEQETLIQGEGKLLPLQAKILFTAQKRGYLNIPEVRLVSQAPFGLVKVSAHICFSSQILVYPQPKKHDLPEALQAKSTDESSQTRPGEEDLSYLKEYQPGHSLQQVAWKVFAKRNKMLVKYFEDSCSCLPTAISYRDYPDNISMDSLASYLCYRVLEAERLHQSYSVILPQATIEPSPTQRTIALSALSLI